MKKTTKSRKPITEREMSALLAQVSFPPFSLSVVETQTAERQDASVELSWNGRSRPFVVEFRASSTPAQLESAVQRIRRASRPPLLWPMVFVPYLGDEQLQQLEREGVSGLDLCGNGVVIVPGEWLVRRTGNPNRYPQSFPIKNVFRGASSLVSRVFLSRPVYGTVGEVREEVGRRGGAVALSTVSKVLRRLEEELIVGRASGQIRLLQADKLLERLTEKYRPPEITRRFVGKCKVPPESLLKEQLDWARKKRVSVALTGVSSVRLYAVMAREEMLSVYCSDVAGLLGRLGAAVQEQNRFPNLELLETDDDCVYFDRRVIEGLPWAPPLQTYLELATGGKREQETAEQIKPVILGGRGDGNGYGDGSGDGRGDGSGYGYGDGYGDGRGDGSGNG